MLVLNAQGRIQGDCCVWRSVDSLEVEQPPNRLTLLARTCCHHGRRGTDAARRRIGAGNYRAGRRRSRRWIVLRRGTRVLPARLPGFRCGFSAAMGLPSHISQTGLQPDHDSALARRFRRLARRLPGRSRWKNCASRKEFRRTGSTSRAAIWRRRPAKRARSASPRVAIWARRLSSASAHAGKCIVICARWSCFWTIQIKCPRPAQNCALQVLRQTLKLPGLLPA